MFRKRKDMTASDQPGAVLLSPDKSKRKAEICSMERQREICCQTTLKCGKSQTAVLPGSALERRKGREAPEDSCKSAILEGAHCLLDCVKATELEFCV